MFKNLILRTRYRVVASVLVTLPLVFVFPPAYGQCGAPSSWFPHSETPKPNDSADFSTNCDFHQWSWQMFLWLTQTEANGLLRFESFATPADLFATTDSTLVAHSDVPEKKMLRLTPRSTKSSGPKSLGEVNQAGSNGILAAPSPDNRAVYYSQHVNDVFYSFIRSNDYNIVSTQRTPWLHALRECREMPPMKGGQSWHKAGGAAPESNGRV